MSNSECKPDICCKIQEEMNDQQRKMSKIRCICFQSPLQECLKLQRMCLIKLSQLKGRNARNKHPVCVFKCEVAEVGEMNLQLGNSLCGQTWPCLIHQAPKGGFNKEMKKQRLDYVRLNVICLSSQRFH